jgi:Fe-S-cluster containining protein
MSEPWYASGLCFECQPDCGACCTNHGDHEYVYLEDEDVDALARHFDLDVGEFKKRFTFVEDGWVALRMDAPDCPFLDGKRCTVYAARPTQCRTFPFWTDNLRSRTRWESLSEFCPGIGRGGRRSLERIRGDLALRDG